MSYKKCRICQGPGGFSGPYAVKLCFKCKGTGWIPQKEDRLIAWMLRMTIIIAAASVGIWLAQLLFEALKR